MKGSNSPKRLCGASLPRNNGKQFLQGTASFSTKWKGASLPRNCAQQASSLPKNCAEQVYQGIMPPRNEKQAYQQNETEQLCQLCGASLPRNTEKQVLQGTGSLSNTMEGSKSPEELRGANLPRNCAEQLPRNCAEQVPRNNRDQAL